MGNEVYPRTAGGRLTGKRRAAAISQTATFDRCAASGASMLASGAGVLSVQAAPGAPKPAEDGVGREASQVRERNEEEPREDTRGEEQQTLAVVASSAALSDGDGRLERGVHGSSSAALAQWAQLATSAERGVSKDAVKLEAVVRSVADRALAQLVGDVAKLPANALAATLGLLRATAALQLPALACRALLQKHVAPLAVRSQAREQYARSRRGASDTDQPGATAGALDDEEGIAALMDVAELWCEAADAVQYREACIDALAESVRAASAVAATAVNSRAHVLTVAAMERRRAEELREVLALATQRVQAAGKALEVHSGDILTLRGVPYLPRMENGADAAEAVARAAEQGAQEPHLWAGDAGVMPLIEAQSKRHDNAPVLMISTTGATSGVQTPQDLLRDPAPVDERRERPPRRRATPPPASPRADSLWVPRPDRVALSAPAVPANGTLPPLASPRRRDSHEASNGNVGSASRDSTASRPSRPATYDSHGRVAEALVSAASAEYDAWQADNPDGSQGGGSSRQSRKRRSRRRRRRARTAPAPPPLERPLPAPLLSDGAISAMSDRRFARSWLKGEDPLPPSALQPSVAGAAQRSGRPSTGARAPSRPTGGAPVRQSPRHADGHLLIRPGMGTRPRGPQEGDRAVAALSSIATAANAEAARLSPRSLSPRFHPRRARSRGSSPRGQRPDRSAAPSAAAEAGTPANGAAVVRDEVLAGLGMSGPTKHLRPAVGAELAPPGAAAAAARAALLEEARTTAATDDEIRSRVLKSRKGPRDPGELLVEVERVVEPGPGAVAVEQHLAKLGEAPTAPDDDAAAASGGEEAAKPQTVPFEAEMLWRGRGGLGVPGADDVDEDDESRGSSADESEPDSDPGVVSTNVDQWSWRVSSAVRSGDAPAFAAVEAELAVAHERVAAGEDADAVARAAADEALRVSALEAGQDEWAEDGDAGSPASKASSHSSAESDADSEELEAREEAATRAAAAARAAWLEHERVLAGKPSPADVEREAAAATAAAKASLAARRARRRRRRRRGGRKKRQFTAKAKEAQRIAREVAAGVPGPRSPRMAVGSRVGGQIWHDGDSRRQGSRASREAQPTPRESRSSVGRSESDAAVDPAASEPRDSVTTKHTASASLATGSASSAAAVLAGGAQSTSRGAPPTESGGGAMLYPVPAGTPPRHTQGAAAGMMHPAWRSGGVATSPIRGNPPSSTRSDAAVLEPDWQVAVPMTATGGEGSPAGVQSPTSATNAGVAPERGPDDGSTGRQQQRVVATAHVGGDLESSGEAAAPPAMPAASAPPPLTARATRQPHVPAAADGARSGSGDATGVDAVRSAETAVRAADEAVAEHLRGRTVEVPTATVMQQRAAAAHPSSSTKAQPKALAAGGPRPPTNHWTKAAPRRRGAAGQSHPTAPPPEPRWPSAAAPRGARKGRALSIDATETPVPRVRTRALSAADAPLPQSAQAPAAKRSVEVRVPAAPAVREPAHVVGRGRSGGGAGGAAAASAVGTKAKQRGDSRRESTEATRGGDDGAADDDDGNLLRSLETSVAGSASEAALRVMNTEAANGATDPVDATDDPRRRSAADDAAASSRNLGVRFIETDSDGRPLPAAVAHVTPSPAGRRSQSPVPAGWAT